MAELTRELWQEVGKAFDVALSLSDPEREKYLKELEAERPRVAHELRSLLAAHSASNAFLEEPIGPKLAEALLTARTLYPRGTKFKDFEILQELGSGSFGTVYRAQDLTLNREVAVKISPNAGEEGKTLASLEHENIVTIFSESVDLEKHLRFICMQYVPGLNLDELLNSFPSEDTLSGKRLLSVLAEQGPENASIDLAALSDRDLLQKLDSVACVLWLGLRLAGALAHAHQRGILHLDVKPGNILIGLQGRPFLADFNISLNQRRREEGPRLLGGTIDYMAPEHSAFLSGKIGSEETLDGRADVYSLGVVLKKLWSLVKEEDVDPLERKRIEGIWETATHADRLMRFSSSEAFAQALSGALEQHQTLKRLPPPKGLTAFFCRHPISGIFLFTLIPQILASLVNISYNSLRIVSHLTVAQQKLFEKSLFLYNPILYSICIVALLIPLTPLYLFAKDPFAKRTPETLRLLRRRALNYPLWVAGVTTMGWSLGALLFPFTLHFFAGGLARSVFFHFFISFLLSWLIALSYSFLYTQFIGVRALYPKLWDGMSPMQNSATQELTPVEKRVTWFYLGTGMIPLLAASLLVFVGPESFEPSIYTIYRWLVTLLIALGMLGFFFSIRATQALAQTLFALEARDGG